MSGGRAFGVARSYQQFCRDYLRRSWPTLLPPAVGDGLDVPFELGGTTWYIDVALWAPDGSTLVAAECRWRRDPVKQEDVAAFAHKVSLLRTIASVEPYFFTRARFQPGAVKAAQNHGIVRAIWTESAPQAGFAVVFPGFDLTTSKRTQGVTVCVPAACAVASAGTPTVLVTRADSEALAGDVGAA